MIKPRYWMTPTAKKQYRNAISDTRDRWGISQAEKYRTKLLAGFQYIAANHQKLNSPHRNKLSEGTEFSLYLVEHRYVAFQKHDKYIIIIAGIFHESMDIPTRLREFQNMAQHEIDTLKRDIGRSSL